MILYHRDYAIKERLSTIRLHLHSSDIVQSSAEAMVSQDYKPEQCIHLSMLCNQNGTPPRATAHDMMQHLEV